MFRFLRQHRQGSWRRETRTISSFVFLIRYTRVELLLQLHFSRLNPWSLLVPIEVENDTDSVKEEMAESRHARRQRRLQQLEIPEDQLTLTNVLLGKGGFGRFTLPTTAASTPRLRCYRFITTSHTSPISMNLIRSRIVRSGRVSWSCRPISARCSFENSRP